MERSRRGTARAAALVVVVMIAASCSAPGSWRVIRPVTRGSTPAPIDVDAFACGSPTNCVALPIFNRGPMPEPPGFGEAWDGTSWAPTDAPARNVHGLSCAGDWCMAVARPSPDPAEPTRVWTRTAGGSWTQVADLGTDLSVGSVDCAADDHCVVIGAPASGGTTGIARHWDGDGWTTISDSRPAATYMSHVQCLADGSCVFVTDGDGQGVPYAFERWDGSAWVDLPHDGTLPKATELSCGTTLATCVLAAVWADDAGTERPAFVRWTGARWQPDPFVLTDFVDEVECLPDGRCLAKTYGQTLTFDGTSWHDTGVQPPESHYLVCATPTACFLQQFTLGASTDPPVIYRWDGTGWQQAPVEPNPIISDAALVGVSCPTATWCLAVGEYKEGLATRPLVERWNGSTWSHVADIPVPADVTVNLKAVSCTAVDRCVTVGSKTRPGEQPSSFVARWNGTTWTDESAASFAANPFPLNDVSCAGSTCIAVGNALSFIVAIRSDTAGTWANMPPPPGAPVIYNERNAVQVACAAATSCAATSVQFLGGGIATNLSYWDGTSWSVPADTGGLSPAFFADVACPAPGSCIAVAGSLGDNSGASATWTGSKWVTQPMPMRFGLVACDRADRCLAGAGMGPVAPGGAAQLSDAQQWNGSTWRPVRRGAPAVPPETVLSDLSCRDGVCVGVGFSSTDPLAYRFRF